jgi:hypothetical protein
VSIAKGERFLPFALQNWKGGMLAVHVQYMALLRSLRTALA